MLMRSKKVLKILSLSLPLLSSVYTVYGSGKETHKIAHSKLEPVYLANVALYMPNNDQYALNENNDINKYSSLHKLAFVNKKSQDAIQSLHLSSPCYNKDDIKKVLREKNKKLKPNTETIQVCSYNALTYICKNIKDFARYNMNFRITHTISRYSLVKIMDALDKFYQANEKSQYSPEFSIESFVIFESRNRYQGWSLNNDQKTLEKFQLNFCFNTVFVSKQKNEENDINNNEFLNYICNKLDARRRVKNIIIETDTTTPKTTLKSFEQAFPYATCRLMRSSFDEPTQSELVLSYTDKYTDQTALKDLWYPFSDYWNTVKYDRGSSCNRARKKFIFNFSINYFDLDKILTNDLWFQRVNQTTCILHNSLNNLTIEYSPLKLDLNVCQPMNYYIDSQNMPVIESLPPTPQVMQLPKQVADKLASMPNCLDYQNSTINNFISKDIDTLILSEFSLYLQQPTAKRQKLKCLNIKKLQLDSLSLCKFLDHFPNVESILFYGHGKATVRDNLLSSNAKNIYMPYDQMNIWTCADINIETKKELMINADNTDFGMLYGKILNLIDADTDPLIRC